MDQPLARRWRVAVVLLVAVLAPPRESAAQIVGLPVSFSPSAQPGVRLFGDYAYGGGDPALSYWGGRALLNLSYVSVAVLAGDRSGPGDAAWGATAELNLLRGASKPVSVSVLGGYGDNDGVSDVPLGVGVALEVTRPGFDIEPWAGLRAHIRDSDVGLGISAGVNARTAALTKIGIPLPGLGAHLALDYLGLEGSAFTLNVGLNYLFEIKSLPPYGIFGGECDPTDPSC